MLSRFVSSTVDEGAATSAIISRSSERRSNRCITESPRSLLTSETSAGLYTLAGEHSSGNRSAHRARQFLSLELEKILVRKEAMLAHAPRTGAPRVAKEPRARHAAADRRAHPRLVGVPVDVHEAPARRGRANDAAQERRAHVAGGVTVPDTPQYP